MDIRVAILKKQQELDDLIKNVDVNQLRATYSRAELKELQTSLKGMKTPHLSTVLLNLMDEMKREEFPQLNSIHHFPVLQAIDFLTLPEKEALDKFLVTLRKGETVYSFYEIIRSAQKLTLLDSWLIENGVMESVYTTLCPNCGNGRISGQLLESKKEELAKRFVAYKAGETDDETESVLEFLHDFCTYCEEAVDVADMESLNQNRDLRMLMERDRSLDNK